MGRKAKAAKQTRSKSSGELNTTGNESIKSSPSMGSIAEAGPESGSLGNSEIESRSAQGDSLETGQAVGDLAAIGPLIRDIIRQEMKYYIGTGDGKAVDKVQAEPVIAATGPIQLAEHLSSIEMKYQAKEDLQVKVRPFNPKESDWFSYKAHFEGLAIQAEWSERTKCTRLLSALQGKLTGVTIGLPSPVTFSELVARIDSVYGLSNAREDAALKLSSCRIEPEETVSMFAERVRQLIERAYPTYTVLDKEQQALQTFLNGLSPKHDMRMQMRVKAFYTLREAAEYGSRLEQIIRDEKQVERRSFPSREATDVNLTQALRHVSTKVDNVRSDQVKQMQLMQELQQKTYPKQEKDPRYNKQAYPRQAGRKGNGTMRTSPV